MKLLFGSNSEDANPRRHFGSELFFVTKLQRGNDPQEVERWTILRDNCLYWFYNARDRSPKSVQELKACSMRTPEIDHAATMEITCAAEPELVIGVYFASILTLKEAAEITKQLMVACEGRVFTQSSGASVYSDTTSVMTTATEAKRNVTMLGEYEVLEMIGEGSFSKIHRVVHSPSGTVYAMKVIDRDRMKKKGMTGACVAERDALVIGKNHPYTLQLHSAFRSKHHFYVVTELCEGGNLSEFLSANKVFTEAQSAVYGAELVLVLEHLHHHNIIHRDLKLSNVFLSAEDGHIRLGDFGFAKVGCYDSRLPNDDIEAETLCGTWGYIAPEMFSDVAYGKEVDWWSFGCIMMLMLCGKKFARSVQNELHRKFSPLMLPNGLSHSARDLIGGLLRKTPENRLGFHGAMDVRSHDFFKDIDWAALKERRVAAPLPVPVALRTLNPTDGASSGGGHDDSNPNGGHHHHHHRGPSPRSAAAVGPHTNVRRGSGNSLSSGSGSASAGRRGGGGEEEGGSEFGDGAAVYTSTRNVNRVVSRRSSTPAALGRTPASSRSTGGGHHHSSHRRGSMGAGTPAQPHTSSGAHSSSSRRGSTSSSTGNGHRSGSSRSGHRHRSSERELEPHPYSSSPQPPPVGRRRGSAPAGTAEQAAEAVRRSEEAVVVGGMEHQHGGGGGEQRARPRSSARKSGNSRRWVDYPPQP